MSGRVIAIDGPAGAGKSTVARAVAHLLNWTFLDTGAMYRAVTWLALHHGVDVTDDEALEHLVSDLTIHVGERVLINEHDVTTEIRSEEVNHAVSAVAACSAVRRALVDQQRLFAQAQELGTVVEGRDITTVVFPDAEVRIFLTASLERRAARRGDESATSVAARDYADRNRNDSPLAIGEGVIVIDSTDMTLDEVVQEVAQCLTR
jgi:cytidylate kinase